MSAQLHHVFGRADEPPHDKAVKRRKADQQMESRQADGHHVGKVEQPPIGLSIMWQRRPRGEEHNHRPLHHQRQRPGDAKRRQVEFGVG